MFEFDVEQLRELCARSTRVNILKIAKIGIVCLMEKLVLEWRRGANADDDDSNYNTFILLVLLDDEIEEVSC